jgi:carbonic anhydrase
MPRTIEQLLENNAAWADKMIAREPDYFEKLALQQTPEYLWVGCSDSRVSADQIVGLMPGEVFVHRNIANLVVHTDLNCLSVLQFAVDVLKVRHVIVCGHYGCGGVRASMDNKKHGLIDSWLLHIQDIALEHEMQLGQLDEGPRLDRLCELNVMQQRENLARTTTVQDAWERGQPLSLHAWIYGLKDGRIRQLAPAIQAKLARLMPRESR